MTFVNCLNRFSTDFKVYFGKQKRINMIKMIIEFTEIKAVLCCIAKMEEKNAQ